MLEPHKPRTGFVINLMAGGLDGSFRQGIGGEFFFSPADTVVQTTGCGTSCATIMLHDTSGKTLGNYLCEGFDEDEETWGAPKVPGQGHATPWPFCGQGERYSRNTLTAAAIGNWLLCRRTSAST